MMFFTPDLLLRADSSEAAIADAAEDEWDAARERYRARLAVLRPTLGKGLRRYLDRCRLHDAWLLDVLLRPANLSLLLRAEDEEVVRLTYELVAPPTLVVHPELAEPEAPVLFLYDELNVATDAAGTVFTHNILFTGGRELAVPFRRFRLTRRPRGFDALAHAFARSAPKLAPPVPVEQ